MVLSAIQLENEFENPELGFRIFKPTTEQFPSDRPRAYFLQRPRHKKRDCVIQKTRMYDVILTPALLRALDKNSLKQTEFHRLWLCGFVDRYGRGTHLLKKAIVNQALALDGDPKIGDAEILKAVDDARESWKETIVRRFGWAALFLAASLQKSGWFSSAGVLSDMAIAFYGVAQERIARAISSKITQTQTEVLSALGRHGKLIFTPSVIENSENKISLRETQNAISWAHANKLIDTSWSLSHLGTLVLRLSQDSRAKYEERLCS